MKKKTKTTKTLVIFELEITLSFWFSLCYQNKKKKMPILIFVLCSDYDLNFNSKKFSFKPKNDCEIVNSICRELGNSTKYGKFRFESFVVKSQSKNVSVFREHNLNVNRAFNTYACISFFNTLPLNLSLYIIYSD